MYSLDVLLFLFDGYNRCPSLGLPDISLGLDSDYALLGRNISEVILVLISAYQRVGSFDPPVSNGRIWWGFGAQLVGHPSIHPPIHPSTHPSIHLMLSAVPCIAVCHMCSRTVHFSIGTWLRGEWEEVIWHLDTFYTWWPSIEAVGFQITEQTLSTIYVFRNKQVYPHSMRVKWL